jgi:hypothetical protein
MKSYCDYCKRLATRRYKNKDFCELHYLLEYPSRGILWVDWDKINRMKSFTLEDKKKLDKIKNDLVLKAVENEKRIKKTK